MSYTPGPRANAIIKLPVFKAKRDQTTRPIWYDAPPTRSRKRCLWVYAEPTSQGVLNAHPSAFKASQMFKGQIKGLTLPLGMLTVINYFPESWEHRLLDERLGIPVSDEDLQWADIVLLSGMYVEGRRANEIAARARVFGKITVMGGPGVTINPKLAPDFDIVHIGDLGDRSYELIQWLDQNDRPPPEQLVFKTDDIIPMDYHPFPAFERVDFGSYLIGMLQFQKGCPFTCEFCDVIEIFGRVAESKSPERYLRELDLLYGLGWRGPVMCVSDNFHANHKAAREVLRAMGKWQKEHEYPFVFATPATLDVADLDDMLDLYREAGFGTIGIGLESSDFETLIHMQKKQNTRHPVVESVQLINSHGIEVTGTLILGFDTDTAESGKKHVALVEEANIVLAACTMLTALEGTQLQRRMDHEGRLRSEWPYMEYKIGYESVRKMFDETIEALCEPKSMFRRLTHQVKNTRPKQPFVQRFKPKNLAKNARVELKRKLGLSNEMTVDSRGRPMKMRPAVNKLPVVLRTALGVMWKFGVVWKDRKHYWDFMSTCVEKGDMMSAMTGPLVVSQWGEMAARNKRGEGLPRVDTDTSSEAPARPAITAPEIPEQGAVMA
jgi:radical SAM superfamily enzyme YgiQ (UPF0313 family)